MALPPLALDDFPAFFQAVQTWNEGFWNSSLQTYPPFPWQARLVREIAEGDRWPDLLDLPTGSGKTVAIDIAVFHLALRADQGETRRAAMRIAFVVDRRLVVDEAFLRAERLADALSVALRDHGSAPQIIVTVAERLQHLAGPSQPPLIARSLRGGMPREDDWARTPCQPTVLCSTVDQVGSRLLFRGYGVSDSMKPVHAGLLGSDALILLDEAHLSQPFRQTAQAIARHKTIRGPDKAPFHVALLTATPGEKTEEQWCFGLGEDDHAHPILAKRLAAPKPVTLCEVGSGETTRAEALADQALALFAKLKAQGLAAPVVGVIANRVGRARAVFEKLKAHFADSPPTLVFGPSRPVDRDRIAKSLAPFKTGADRPQDAPHVIVATQALEAGVDIDLDGLVTDAASLDALRQRFGRLNRQGRDVPACGIILADKADRKPKKDGDPIYGEAIGKTLTQLFPQGNEVVDFGIAALEKTLETAELFDEALKPLLADKPNAPVLMPAYVDLWSHTAPIPSVDPDVALFLHGANRDPASVQLVWRADVDERLDARNSGQSGRLRALLALVPPRATEAIDLPVWAVRRWLFGETRIDVADVVQSEPAESAPEHSPKGPVFCWRGADDDGSRIIDPKDIRPGDTIVVPATYGGCDQYGWNPESGEPVVDVYDEASEPYAGKRYVVRVAPGLIREAVRVEDDNAAPGPFESKEARQERLAAATEAIAQSLREAFTEPSLRAGAMAQELARILPARMRERLEQLAKYKRRLDPPAYPYGGEDGERPGAVLIAPFGIEVPTKKAEETIAASSTEDDETGSFPGRDERLVKHSHGVARLAAKLARAAGFSERLAADIGLAGWLHDAGKADLRFQRLLFNGDLLAMEASEPLAKSAAGRSSPGARVRAKLPEHWRHEALSVRLALERPRLQEAHDRALVIWLVGVHHGHGRPFFPHIDPHDETFHELAAVEGLSAERLDAGFGPQSLAFVIEGEVFRPTHRDCYDLRGADWATMFRDLRSRYGAWGLARMEVVLRLADHRASEASREKEAT